MNIQLLDRFCKRKSYFMNTYIIILLQVLKINKYSKYKYKLFVIIIF